MNVFYSDIEQEVVNWLAPLTVGGGLDVVPLPQLQADFERPFLKGRITVAYKSSDFGDVINTHQIVQDEKIQIELIIQSRVLRGADGLHAMTEAVKRRLLGFRPTDCTKMYLVKNGFTDHNNETALWSYSMIFETKYRIVEDFEFNTEPTLQEVLFEYNEEPPAIPAVPFPGTFPQPPVINYKGDLAYWDGEVWRRLHPGEPGYVLATMGEGEVPEWVEPQSGPQGPQGDQGPAGADGAPGPAGADGAQGPQGVAGADGADGLSAYEVALNNGFVGTELEWLASLEGPQGPQGPAGADGAPGADGATGPQGPAGPTAVSADAGNQATLGGDGLIFVPLPSGGITIGTTAITSGTDGRVLFQNGGVVQQDSTLFWDNTNKRLGVGATPSSTVRLDVRAQGALSTDIALRVRNSANASNLLELRGNTTFDFPTYLGGYIGGLGSEVRMGNAGTFYTQANQFVVTGSSVVTATNGAFIQDSVGQNVLFNSRFVGTSQISLNMGRANIHLGGLTADTHTGHNILGIANGTAPSASYTDRFMLYSADQTAGNAAPHFRTENGSIIKLYKQDLPTAPTNAEIATLLSNLGLANLI